jgi:hypothetical protein
VFLVLRENGT